MALALTGISVARGVAIGKAYLLKHDDVEIGEYIIPKPLIGEEVARYRAAVRKTRRQLRDVRRRVAEHASADIAGFVDAHLLMLRDSQLVEEPIRTLKARGCNAEWALKLQRDILITAFEEIDDPYLSARKDDVKYVVERILRNLLEQPDMGQQNDGAWLKGCIVIADEITPDEVISLHQQGVAALVTEFGGPNSHTAILSRSLGIPTVVGLHHAQRYLKQSDLLIVDGANGLVCAAPDKLELEFYRRHQERQHRLREQLDTLRDQPVVTLDGRPILLQCNMELESDLQTINEVDGGGIGLFRTEMLFMNRRNLPDEDEQFEFYAMVVRAMKGEPVTIRTLDIGADKQLESLCYIDAGHPNPALGLRAIRLCLREPDLFIPQLRAILRASSEGPIRIMVPLLTTLQESLQVLHLIDRQKQSLLKSGYPVADQVPVGGMIEVPAAAIMADMFARHLDFLSIGTNDLIQYTLAADRLDDEVNYLFDPLHPAVLRLIRMTIRAGEAAGIPVSMCGEMAADPRYTRLLLGLGLREFSMQPSCLLEVKRIINNSHAGVLRDELAGLDGLYSSEEVSHLVDRVNQSVAAMLV